MRKRNPCACGCGKLAPVIFRESGPRKGHVKRYAQFIPGHGNRDWGRRMKAMLPGTLDLLPIGATRLHHSNPTLVYRQIKAGPGRAGWRFEHRVVVEQHIGRRLDRNEHVHHRNGNTLDNRIENLVCMSHSDHSKHHHNLQRWAKKFDHCRWCGTDKKEHVGHGLCTTCYQRSLIGITPRVAVAVTSPPCS